TDGMLAMEKGQQSQSVQEVDIDELVSWLEDIWLEEEGIRESVGETEWNEFIDSVKNSYP
ncbi:MAG: hypothetical protein KAX31_04910, partial [Thermoplasmata archaeon]|nr:hypothetical protein [Thermoplasmata archaeon]